MEIKQIRILKEQIDEIDNLKSRVAYGPEFRIWEATTLKLIRKLFDEPHIDLFKTSAPRKMPSSPRHQQQLYVKDLNERRVLLEGFLSEVKRFKETREVDVSRLTALENYDFHPKIKEVSQKLYEDKH